MEGTLRKGDAFQVTRANDFERNDIVVFDYFGEDYTSPPTEEGKYEMHWEKRIFRMIAVSGDTLLIKDGDVFINSHPIPLPATALCEYEVISMVPVDDFPEWNDPEAIIATTNNKDSFRYLVLLTSEEALAFRQRKPGIMSVNRQKFDYIFPDSMYARSSADNNRSADNYGPLVIPKPGSTVVVDPANYKLYHNIPGIKIGKNIIAEPLYFVMGDNRHGAQDSRFIGFISHSNMHGIVK